MKTINVFKNNSRTLPYSIAPEISELNFANGKLTAKITGGLDGGDTIEGFDHSFKVVRVAFAPISGAAAAQALNVFNGTSAAANKLAVVRPVANSVNYLAASFYPNKADIAAGGKLVFTVSGTTWGTAMTGRLTVETIPL